jgi:hypothetical protein
MLQLERREGWRRPIRNRLSGVVLGVAPAERGGPHAGRRGQDRTPEPRAPVLAAAARGRISARPRDPRLSRAVRPGVASVPTTRVSAKAGDLRFSASEPLTTEGLLCRALQQGRGGVSNPVTLRARLSRASDWQLSAKVGQSNGVE